MSLGGLTLTDNLRSEFKHVLPPGLVVPANDKLVLWLDGAPQLGPTHVPFTLNAAGGELGLFDGVSRAGVVSLVYYAPPTEATSYARIPDGAETWGPRPPVQVATVPH